MPTACERYLVPVVFRPYADDLLPGRRHSIPGESSNSPREPAS
ncbi:hypothetical protein ACOZCG_25610 [Streptomyces pseudogriseolus]